jgi:CheY-like chemotaxis protein
MMLQNSGFVVSEATESERAIEQIRGANFDALLLDLHLADMSALELLRRCPMRPPTVLTTGSVSEVPMDEARALGVVEVVRKPFSAAGLIASMDRALTQPKRGVPANDAAVYLDMPVVTEFRTVAGRAAGEQFVRKAIHDAERVVDQLSHAAASMNSALWLEHVQTLSGIAATMGAKTLKTTAEEALNLKFADIPSRAAAFDERFRDVLAKTIEQLIAPNIYSPSASAPASSSSRKVFPTRKLAAGSACRRRRLNTTSKTPLKNYTSRAGRQSWPALCDAAKSRRIDKHLTFALGERGAVGDCYEK